MSVNSQRWDGHLGASMLDRARLLGPRLGLISRSGFDRHGDLGLLGPQLACRRAVLLACRRTDQLGLEDVRLVGTVLAGPWPREAARPRRLRPQKILVIVAIVAYSRFGSRRRRSSGHDVGLSMWALALTLAVALNGAGALAQEGVQC